ncbi:hypothetical protein SK355_11005 [Candidatus Fukatsuia symbiotica]|nr:hypothetical protein [Candidatus Fukatsuia symbiotica]MEA9445716.1 hypothetical protein [Candidatus Fukatsuia symbiotica]
MIGTVTQNNFFVSYDNTNRYNIFLKKQVVNYGHALKEKISNHNKVVINSKLNNIATRIQKRINRANLSSDDLSRYPKELDNLLKEDSGSQKENIRNFFKCCIFLSKHNTEKSTKNNYFYFTNKTHSLRMLSKMDCLYSNIPEITEEKLNVVLSDILLHIDYFREDQSIEIEKKTESYVVERKKENIYSYNKFKFLYSSEELSVTEKMVEEDTYALKILNSEDSKKSVISVARMLHYYLKKNLSSIRKQNDFFETYKFCMQNRIGTYPIFKIKNHSFKDILEIFKKNEDHIILLSLIWPIFIEGNGTGSDIKK